MRERKGEKVEIGGGEKRKENERRKEEARRWGMPNINSRF